MNIRQLRTSTRLTQFSLGNRRNDKSFLSNIYGHSCTPSKLNMLKKCD